MQRIGGISQLPSVRGHQNSLERLTLTWGGRQVADLAIPARSSNRCGLVWPRP